MFVWSLCVQQKRFGVNPWISCGVMTYRSDQGLVTFLNSHGSLRSRLVQVQGAPCLRSSSTALRATFGGVPGKQLGSENALDLAHFDKSLHHNLFMDLHQIFCCCTHRDYTIIWQPFWTILMNLSIYGFSLTKKS